MHDIRQTSALLIQNNTYQSEASTKSRDIAMNRQAQNYRTTISITVTYVDPLALVSDC